MTPELLTQALEELEPELRANAHSENNTLTDHFIINTDNKKFTAHFKLTHFSGIEGTFASTHDLSSRKDDQELQQEESSSRCGCFGRLFKRKS